MKRLFARISNGKVVEFINEVNDIDKEWHEDFVKMLVDITKLKKRPEMDWVYEDGKFSPPPPQEYSIAQKMIMAMTAGCEIVCNSNPDLSAVYYPNGKIWQMMRDEVLYIVSFGSFSGDYTELHWPVHDGEVIFTDTDKFKMVTKAISDWITKWNAFVIGKADSPPTLPVTID